MAKVILHIDLNAFFVRCEELVDPTLKGKAVIIGHAGRGGVVSTCSYEARKYGIHSGMPTFKAIKLCPDVTIIPGHYELYSRKSHEFINFVRKHSAKIEQASIDECYVDMTEKLKKEPKPLEYIKDMQDSLLKETGLMCSIGVAPTKFLAKMGSDYKKPMGITVIHRKDIPDILYPLPIESFFGIGKKTAPQLRAMGVNTIGDLAKLINEEDPQIKSEFGKFFYAYKDLINGYGNDEVDTEPWDPKSLGNSTTFKYNTNNIEEIKEYIRHLSKEVSDRAKEANKVGSTVQLVLKDKDFKVINRSKRLNKPTNDFYVIFQYAVELLEANLGDKMIRLAGVTLQNLVDPTEVVIQMSIFDNYEEIKEECAVKLLIGELNRKMKKPVFKTAADSLRDKKYGIKKIITTTTREKRINEVDGVDYFFVTKEEFEMFKVG